MRRLLLDEAAGRESGSALLNFDMTDVRLDFDANTATVVDVLGSLPDETQPLATFLAAAAAFGDSPLQGDGTTLLQRNPPKYAVSADGNVAPANEE